MHNFSLAVSAKPRATRTDYFQPFSWCPLKTTPTDNPPDASLISEGRDSESAHTSGQPQPATLTESERHLIDRLLVFAQQQAGLAATHTDNIASFCDGVAFGYWASARAICEQRQISLAETKRLCGAKPPTAAKKGN